MPTRHSVGPDTVLDAVAHRIANPDPHVRIRGLELLEAHFLELAPWDMKRIAEVVTSTDWWGSPNRSLAERNLAAMFEQAGVGR